MILVNDNMTQEEYDKKCIIIGESLVEMLNLTPNKQACHDRDVFATMFGNKSTLGLGSSLLTMIEKYNTGK